MASPAKLWLALVLVWLATSSAFADGPEWFTDVEAAQAKARDENKVLLLNFTGSDWCPWCRKLKEEVFDQPEFAAFAAEKLILADIDFPRHKALPEQTKQVYDKLAQALHVETLPTVALLDPTGRLMGRTGYVAGGPGPFIEQLRKIVVDKLTEAQKPAPEAPEPPRKPAAFVPIAPAVPVRYNELALKAISGPKNRRMALINNENFFVGDTAKVKLLDDRIEVHCKEIRDDSVLITANGKPMELKLRRR